jgi:adenosylmethionine-8-amino-7-oxononanoate aminotransferase
VASLGHGHPRLLARLEAQARTLDHVALAGITHEPAVLLAEELVAVAPRGLTRVFYTDNGSGSIEVAVKMCLQGQAQRGQPRRTRFVALDGAFHGDTLGATSLGGVDVFRRPYAGVLFDCVRPPPHDEDGRADFARAFAWIAELLRREGDTVAGVFVEPVVQGAAGMRVYDPALLRELRAACTAAGAWLVFDEVFTGYGRTGTMWACDHAGVAPDLMCLGKTFASIVPMGATLATEEVHRAFAGGRETTLWYGHTFCGTPLGAALAREVLAIVRDEDVVGQARAKGERMARAFADLGRVPGVVRTRAIGMVAAADLATHADYSGSTGWRVYEEGLARGAYLRPLGDTVYLCPPLTIPDAELEELLGIFEASVRAGLASAEKTLLSSAPRKP